MLTFGWKRVRTSFQAFKSFQCQASSLFRSKISPDTGNTSVLINEQFEMCENPRTVMNMN